MRIARAPEQLATRLAERVERAEQREIAQSLLLETDTTREFVEAVERAAAVALGDDALRLGGTESFDTLETETDVMRAALAMGGDRVGEVLRMIVGERSICEVARRSFFNDGFLTRQIHFDGQDRNAVSLSVARNDGRRVEPHGLVIEQADVELGGVVELQMRGVVRGERERSRVALAEPELRECRDLTEDLVGDIVVHPLRARAIDERGAQL